MNIPITQSREWQALQKTLGKESFFVSTKDYQYLTIKMTTPVGNYLYLPYGPVVDTDKGARAALKALKALAFKEKAFFIRIEPQNPAFIKALPSSARKVKDISPADTWVLDLTPDQATLVSHFSQGTRTRYNTYAKKGLAVEQTKDVAALEYLVALQGELFEKKHLTAYKKEYLAAELSQPFATLYLVRYCQSKDASKDATVTTTSLNQSPQDHPADGQVLAASLFFDYSGTRYYMQSAADTHYRRLPATVALLTNSIMDAKEQGITQFDFWGIAPDRTSKDHPWYGFTEFKKSFGGEPRHYAGTYDLPVQSARYRLYRLLRRLKH